jgi:hypothetical protein
LNRPQHYGQSLRPWQQENHAAIDGALQAVAGRGLVSAAKFWRQYLELPRGSAKTLSEAVNCAYLLFASRRAITGICAAADAEQSRLVRDSLSRLAAANGWLGGILTVDRYRVTNRHTGSELHVISSDAASSYGWLIDFAICDEVNIWHDSARALWDSIASAVAKKQHCLWTVAGNAGWLNSWQHEVREMIRTDPRWHFVMRTEPAEWITQENLAEQKRLLLPAAFQRLWRGVWIDDHGTGLNQSEIDRAVRLIGPASVKPSYVTTTVIGVDLSYRRDHSGVVALGVDPHHHKIIVLDRARFNPRDFADGQIDFQAVKAKCCEFRDRFHCTSLRGDSFQAISLSQELARVGFHDVAVRPTNSVAKNQEATILAEVLREDMLRMFAGTLVEDLRSARVVERPTGLAIVFPRNESGHGDEGQALLAALPAAHGDLMAFINGEDDYWPGDEPQRPLSWQVGADNWGARVPDESAEDRENGWVPLGSAPLIQTATRPGHWR